jgi:hypothetical protein
VRLKLVDSSSHDAPVDALRNAWPTRARSDVSLTSRRASSSAKARTRARGGSGDRVALAALRLLIERTAHGAHGALLAAAIDAQQPSGPRLAHAGACDRDDGTRVTTPLDDARAMLRTLVALARVDEPSSTDANLRAPGTLVGDRASGPSCTAEGSLVEALRAWWLLSPRPGGVCVGSLSPVGLRAEGGALSRQLLLAMMSLSEAWPLGAPHAVRVYVRMSTQRETATLELSCPAPIAAHALAQSGSTRALVGTWSPRCVLWREAARRGPCAARARRGPEGVQLLLRVATATHTVQTPSRVVRAGAGLAFLEHSRGAGGTPSDRQGAER